MGKLNCPCGEQLSNVSSPNEVEGYLISDMDLEACGDIEAVDVLSVSRGVWECSACGRLAFDWPNKNDRTVKWYLPENSEQGHLMKRSN